MADRGAELQKMATEALVERGKIETSPPGMVEPIISPKPDIGILKNPDVEHTSNIYQPPPANVTALPDIAPKPPSVMDRIKQLFNGRNPSQTLQSFLSERDALPRDNQPVSLANYRDLKRTELKPQPPSPDDSAK
jgi:hypothetical protein